MNGATVSYGSYKQKQIFRRAKFHIHKNRHPSTNWQIYRWQ